MYYTFSIKLLKFIHSESQVPPVSTQYMDYYAIIEDTK